MCNCDQEAGNSDHNLGKSCGCDCNLKLEGFIIPCLLLLLFTEGPSHGYHLIEKLSKLPFFEVVPDPAVVYRHLRSLENNGMIKSQLVEGSKGPARKVYSLTEEGETYLGDWVPVIESKRDALDHFLNTVQKYYE